MVYSPLINVVLPVDVNVIEGAGDFIVSELDAAEYAEDPFELDATTLKV